MEVPLFSIFSAVSELFVTAIVLYAIIKNMKGGPLPWKMLGAVPGTRTPNARVALRPFH